MTKVCDNQMSRPKFNQEDMKIFTTSINRTMTKGVLLLSFVALSIVGCQREIEPPLVGPEVDPDELTLTAALPQPLDQQFAPPTKSESSLDEFTTGSAISLYVQRKADADAGSSTVMKSNAHYRYDLPIWQPMTKADKLMYHDTDPVYVFGFYPHPDMAASTTAVTPGSALVQYTMHKDQSLPQNAKASDLLWVGAKNGGNGYRRQYVPVNLLFQHMLCKVSFYIKLIDSKPETGLSTNISLKSLATVGSQITNKAEFNALTGIMTPQYEADKTDSIRWESASPTGVPLVVGGDAVHVTDMLLIPFVAQATQNWFRYVLYYPDINMIQNFTAQIPQYDPSATGNQPGMMQFVANKHNKVTVTMDVSTSYISVSASIEPWAQGSNSELPSEPE